MSSATFENLCRKSQTATKRTRKGGMQEVLFRNLVDDRLEVVEPGLLVPNFDRARLPCKVHHAKTDEHRSKCQLLLDGPPEEGEELVDQCLGVCGKGLKCKDREIVDVVRDENPEGRHEQMTQRPDHPAEALHARRGTESQDGLLVQGCWYSSVSALSRCTWPQQ